jgi:hypothetical protein
MDLANVKLWNKLDFQFFSQCFEGNFNYPISQLQISIDVCAHISSTLWVSTSCIVLIVTNILEPMMQFVTPLLSLHEMSTFTWDEKNYMHFFQLCSTPFVEESTLCSPKMAFAP